jgi:hypothetical protein
MSVLVALGILLLVLVVIDLALTAGIIRRLRLDGTPAVPSNEAPRVGLRVDLARDGQAWPVQARGMLEGIALAAFVVPGCIGCERLRRDVDAAAMPVPFYVIGDPLADGNDEYLPSWTAAQFQLLAPVPVHELDSFERPVTYPSLMLLRDGVVVASGHRLADVSDAMERFVNHPMPRRVGARARR